MRENRTEGGRGDEKEEEGEEEGGERWEKEETGMGEVRWGGEVGDLSSQEVSGLGKRLDRMLEVWKGEASFCLDIPGSTTTTTSGM